MRPKIVGFLNWTYLANATHNTECETLHSTFLKFKSHRYLPHNTQSFTILSRTKWMCVRSVSHNTSNRKLGNGQEKRNERRNRKKRRWRHTAHDIQTDNIPFFLLVNKHFTQYACNDTSEIEWIKGTYSVLPACNLLICT